MKRSKKFLIIGGIGATVLAGPAACGGALLFVAITATSSSASANPCASQTGMVNPGAITITGGVVTIDGVKLDKVQQGHAKLIAQIGQLRGFSQYSIAIAIATAYHESELYNLNYGHLDSLGLYQQRPSVKAWGTAAQILNPVHAINKFYDALGKIKDRDSNPSMMEVAIDVQIPSRAAYVARWRWDTLGKTLAAMYAKSAPTTIPANLPSVGCEGTGTGEVTKDGWQLPLRSAYRISSHFNPARKHPITGVVRPHNGVDLAAPSGTPVYAVQAGRVVETKRYPGRGNYVLIQHSGNIQSGYAHLTGFAAGIGPGVTVTSGQLIGYVGNTGLSDGAHLHLETLVGGKYQNPLTVLGGLGVKF